VKAIVRRLQLLERVQEAQFEANDASGAREALLERVKRIAERLRSDPNWVEPTAEEKEHIKQRIDAFFSQKFPEHGQSAT
jgi:hypothetical protein